MSRITFILQLEDGSTTSLQLPPGVYTVGRDPRSDVVLRSLGASCRPARVEVSSEAVLVQDLGSSSGTYRGQKRLQ